MNRLWIPGRTDHDSEMTAISLGFGIADQLRNLQEAIDRGSSRLSFGFSSTK